MTLQDAARSLSYSLVKLLGDNGAISESQFWDSVTSRNFSLLDYAVERLSYILHVLLLMPENYDVLNAANSGPSPKKSVFKLIITLCLPQMVCSRYLKPIVDFNYTNIVVFSKKKRKRLMKIPPYMLGLRQSDNQYHSV